ncbi:MAG: tRNA pseudouridine(38-40) synthase TruA [Cyanobacteria bacterium SBC]|nr:tRNA pseudouridine(38-40) synthase TruA [Cyanobacteria bacterium SBC]
MFDRRPAPNQRVALLVQYLGSGFHGWQWQPNQRSVQAELETVIEKIAGYPVRVCAAGRTDTGVHAAGQVAHFDINSPIPAHKWAVVLNNHLPDGVLVRASAPVSFDWHAQYSAIWRRYRYTLYTEAQPNLFVDPFVWHYYHTPIDETDIQAALKPLVGRHHLSAFRRAGSKRAHSWVDIHAAECCRRGAFVTIEVQASGFLYGMMRLLVGMLVQVGSQRRSIDDFHHIWKNERREAVKYAAPAKGLCLIGIGYPEPPFPAQARSSAMPHFAFDPLPISC